MVRAGGERVTPSTAPPVPSTATPRRSPRTSRTSHSTPSIPSRPASSPPPSISPRTRQRKHEELVRDLFPETWEERPQEGGDEREVNRDSALGLAREEESAASDAETSIVEDSEDERLRNNIEESEVEEDHDEEESASGLLMLDKLTISTTIIPITTGHVGTLAEFPLIPQPSPPTYNRQTPRARPAPKEIECICIDDDDDEDEEAVDEVTRRVVAEKQVEAENFEDQLVEIEEDVDPNEGILIYHPTPRTIRKTMPTDRHPTNPSPTKSKARPGSKLIQVLDLTSSSSDSDSDLEIITPKKSLFPPRPTTALAVKPKKTKPSQLPSRFSSSTVPASSPSLPTPSKSRSSKSKSSSTLSATDRATLPLLLIRELDKDVFRRKWTGLKRDFIREDDDWDGTGLPKGIEVKWSNTLRNTAGRASWKKERIGGITTHHTTIELATKVIDSAEKLKHTLSHELCHVAAWALSNELKPPHGAAFQLWGKRVMAVRPDISITTTHSYKIDYKFRWRCTNGPCSHIFGRHSNSIDPTRSRCSCGSKIIRVDKEGNEIITKSPSPNATPRKKSAWDEFREVNAPILKAANPGISQNELFRLVGREWQEVKKRDLGKDGTGMGALEKGLEELVVGGRDI